MLVPKFSAWNGIDFEAKLTVVFISLERSYFRIIVAKFLSKLSFN